VLVESVLLQDSTKNHEWTTFVWEYRQGDRKDRVLGNELNEIVLRDGAWHTNGRYFLKQYGSF
jgi:hypothetical protein